MPDKDAASVAYLEGTRASEDAGGRCQGRLECGPVCGGGRHHLAFTPYCERAFLRSLTPAASSVPRMTL